MPGPNMPRRITINRPNQDVLAALESLTGRNFGYDLRAWKRWLNSSYRAEQEPARRIAQP